MVGARGRARWREIFANPCPRHTAKRIGTLVIAGLMAGIVAVVAARSPEIDVRPRPVTGRGELNAGEKATIGLFEKARDSVVFITTREQVRDFWSRSVFSVPRGSGSGFIWDESGNVVTNYHVIEGASEATVKLANGNDYRATLVGASPMHDIAVLKIGTGYRHPPPVPLGSSHDLKVGQRVFASGVGAGR